jgi:hypothetical protein
MSMKPLRVLVCGGRDFTDRSLVWRKLDEFSYGKDITLIQGGATGADRFAYEWGAFRRHCIELITERANWGAHGKAAGPIRNQKMIDEHKPDLVLAFPGGRGTADMVRRAKAAGIEVVEVPA